MKTSVYVIVNKRGSVRTTKRPPDLQAGEVATHLNIEIEDRHFKQLFPQATLTLGEEHLVHPEIEIEPEVMSADGQGE